MDAYSLNESMRFHVNRPVIIQRRPSVIQRVPRDHLNLPGGRETDTKEKGTMHGFQKSQHEAKVDSILCNMNNDKIRNRKRHCNKTSRSETGLLSDEDWRPTGKGILFYFERHPN